MQGPYDEKWAVNKHMQQVSWQRTENMNKFLNVEGKNLKTNWVNRKTSKWKIERAKPITRHGHINKMKEY